jgi:hypothetical protein
LRRAALLGFALVRDIAEIMPERTFQKLLNVCRRLADFVENGSQY